jgi:ABC-type glycerol-3-phosphate transport system substrate-binding protein
MKRGAKRGSTTRRRWIAVLTAMSVLSARCGTPAADPEPATSQVEDASGDTGDAEVAEGKTAVGLWTHSAGNPAEMEAIEEWLQAYNATLEDHPLVVEAFPQGA